MKASIFFRIAAVLLLLFAVGHTLGFRQNVPEWRAGSVIGSMQSVHFNAQGFNRTYWDLFTGFGLYFSVFLLLAAVLAWQLGGVTAASFGPFTHSTAWTLSICFIAVTALSWEFAFTIPLIFSSLITVCLISATWLARKPI